MVARATEQRVRLLERDVLHRVLAKDASLEREVFKNTKRNMCARKLVGLPRGILRVAHRLSLVA